MTTLEAVRDELPEAAQRRRETADDPLEAALARAALFAVWTRLGTEDFLGARDPCQGRSATEHHGAALEHRP